MQKSSGSTHSPAGEDGHLIDTWRDYSMEHIAKFEDGGAKSRELLRINRIAEAKGRKSHKANEEHNQRMAHYLTSVHAEQSAKHDERRSRMPAHVKDVWDNRQIDFILQRL